MTKLSKLVTKKYPEARNERDPLHQPISSHNERREYLESLGHRQLCQLLILVREATHLVEQLETFGGPVDLSGAEIASLALPWNAYLRLLGLSIQRAAIDPKGIELEFETEILGLKEKWFLQLTRHKPGNSAPSP